LRELCPEGIDVYFDNVGGETLDAALMCLNEGARVPLCGMISTYQTAEPYRLANLFMAIRKRATLTGFTIYDHFPQKMPTYRVQMVAWLAQGKMRYEDVIVEGIENTPRAFAAMLAGEHGIGKCLVRVGPEPSLATAAGPEDSWSEHEYRGEP
jgi:NADPH-dependent curcumin reductase CurA